MVESSVTRVTARKTACARTGHELRLPGTTVSLLWVLMLYHRLASDGDMTEEAELRELEGGEVRGGASRRLGMHHLPTVTGVQVGCTTSQDAMRMGAVFVVPVHCGEVHRDSTDRTATVVGADVVEEHRGGPQPGGYVSIRGRAPATTAAGARPCYHPLPPRTKRERGARPAAPLRRHCCRGNRRQSFGKVHRRLPEASCAMPSPWAPPAARLLTSTSHAECGHGGWCVQRGRNECASCTAHNSCFV